MRGYDWLVTTGQPCIHHHNSWMDLVQEKYHSWMLVPLCLFTNLPNWYYLSAVTSAMRKNSRWSGISVSGLNMGSLGMSMGLRTGLSNGKDSNYRNQVYWSVNVVSDKEITFFDIFLITKHRNRRVHWCMDSQIFVHIWRLLEVSWVDGFSLTSQGHARSLTRRIGPIHKQTSTNLTPVCC